MNKKTRALLDQAIEFSLARSEWCRERLYAFVLEGRDPLFLPRESNELVAVGLAIPSAYKGKRIFFLQKVQDHDRDRAPVFDESVQYAFKVAPDVVDYIRRSRTGG